jgi:hypothetical protein
MIAVVLTARSSTRWFLHLLVAIMRTSSSKVGFVYIQSSVVTLSKQERAWDYWRFMHLAPIAIVVDRSQRPAIQSPAGNVLEGVSASLGSTFLKHIMVVT